jgi:hypothetical protein
MEGAEMSEVADKPRPPAPVRLVNVIFWQLAGIAIGGLLPAAAISVTAYHSEQVAIDIWILLAILAAIPTAAIGGAVGTLIGICDRRPPFGPRRGRQHG